MMRASRLILLTLVLALMPLKGLGLTSDECIEKGGQSLCIPTAYSNWCYLTNPLVDNADPPLRPVGLGFTYACYASEEEALAAWLGYFSKMELTTVDRPLAHPPLAIGFVNGQVISEFTRYGIRCVPEKPGRCVVLDYMDVTRFKFYGCALAGVQGGADDPTAAPSQAYRDYRLVCPVSMITANEDSCPVGNPVALGSGRKTQPELDYASAGHSLLSFSRFYDSGAPSWIGYQFLGNRWSTNIATEFFEPGGAPGASPMVRLPRSQAEAFKSAGAAWEGAIDAKGKLSRVVDESGNTVAWRHYGSDGRLRSFGPTAKLVSEEAPDGRWLRYTYDEEVAPGPACPVQVTWSGAPRCVTDQFGRQIAFEYTSNGRLSRMHDPSGTITSYAYDEAGYFRSLVVSPGLLTSVVYPDGSARYYHYNEVENTSGSSTDWLLTGISELIEPASVQRFATFKYDTQRRSIYTGHAGGADAHSIEYPSSFSRAYVDPLGSRRTVSFQISANTWRQLSVAQPAGAGSSPCSDAKAYDTRGNVASRTDFKGVKTCYAYDLTRNLETKRVEGVAGGADCATALVSPPTGSRVISTQWHPDWRLETRIAEPNKITTFLYNGQGATCAPSAVLVDGKPPAVVCSRSEQATTDSSGALGFGAGLSGTPRTWSYTYATYGRELTATDPNGRITTTIYFADDDPDKGRRGNVASITNAAGHVTRITAYNLQGQPTQVVDPNGLITDLTYDARMRLTSRKVGSELTTLSYDLAGQLTKITLPDGSAMNYSYDAAHRLIAVADHKGNRIDYMLDAMGNRVSERASDPGGVLVKNLQRTIDALNRLQQVIGEQ